MRHKVRYFDGRTTLTKIQEPLVHWKEKKIGIELRSIVCQEIRPKSPDAVPTWISEHLVC